MSRTISPNFFPQQPLLIVISGMSGAGKDAVIKALKKRDLSLYYVITATSRDPRPGEVHGKDYFFYPPAEFQERIDRGEFAEHANVYGQLKGIPRSQIEEALASGKDVVLKLDVQGAETIRRLYPQAVLINIFPPSDEEWLRHLRERNTEKPHELEERIDTSRKELERISVFDYFVINREGALEQAVDDVVNIIRVEHLRVNPRKTL